MRLILNFEKPIKLEVELPILVRDETRKRGPNVQQGDLGRLFLRPSQPASMALLETLSHDARTERQRELALLANPQRKTPLGTQEMYLGRYEAVEVNNGSGVVELAPYPELPLIWNRVLPGCSGGKSLV
jgi:hypothetical protein